MSAVVLAFLTLSILIRVDSTCWLNRNMKLIDQSNIAFLKNYQFSIHPTSGTVLSKQYRDKTKQTIFYGDFGMLRLYNKNQVAVFQGAYMKISPLVHRIEPWFGKKYELNNILELQIMYVFAFGKRDGIEYENIGISYFIASQSTTNFTRREIGQKFVNELMNLKKGDAIKLENYYLDIPGNIANNLYIYRAKVSEMEKFLPLAEDKKVECKEFPWVIQRKLIEVDEINFKNIKNFFNIGELKESQKIDGKRERVFSVKLRNQNKKERGISVKVVEDGTKEKQSNSCPQNQQL